MSSLFRSSVVDRQILSSQFQAQWDDICFAGDEDTCDTWLPHLMTALVKFTSITIDTDLLRVLELECSLICFFYTISDAFFFFSEVNLYCVGKVYKHNNYKDLLGVRELKRS